MKGKNNLPPNWCIKNNEKYELKLTKASKIISDVAEGYWGYNSTGAYYGIIESKYRNKFDNKYGLSFCTKKESTVESIPGMVIFKNHEEFENYINREIYEIY